MSKKDDQAKADKLLEKVLKKNVEAAGGGKKIGKNKYDMTKAVEKRKDKK